MLAYGSDTYIDCIRERFDLIRRIAEWDDMAVMHCSLEDHNLGD